MMVNKMEKIKGHAYTGISQQSIIYGIHYNYNLIMYSITYKYLINTITDKSLEEHEEQNEDNLDVETSCGVEKFKQKKNDENKGDGRDGNTQHQIAASNLIN